MDQSRRGYLILGKIGKVTATLMSESKLLLAIPGFVLERKHLFYSISDTRGGSVLCQQKHLN